MNVSDFLSRKAQLEKKLRARNPSAKTHARFFQDVLSIIREEIPFHVGWVFPVDPRSMKRSEDCLQLWNSEPPQVETGSLFLDDHLFPGVDDLKKKPGAAVQGEDWWSNADLMEHPFYKQVLKPEGLFFAYLSLLFGPDQECIAYLVLWKKRTWGHFSEQDCALLSDFFAKTRLLLRQSNGSQPSSSPDSAAQSQEARLFNPIEKTGGIEEEELYSLIRRRAQPGILILNQNGDTLYLNHDAKLFLEGLTKTSHPLRSKKTNKPSESFKQNESVVSEDRIKNATGSPLPEIVYQLYAQFATMTSTYDMESETALPTVNRICIHDGRVYLLRALLLQTEGALQTPAHFMILIEKVSQGVRVDQIDWTARLTPRENEVVDLLLEGKTNKEIAVRIDIGEYTVKDHIKRIMKKLDVTTRAGIVAKVLQHHFPA